MRLLTKISQANEKNSEEMKNSTFSSMEIMEESDDELDINPDFRLPYFTDSESESEENRRFSQKSTKTSSSGYNTDPEIDMDWEIFKIVNAPTGPVPSEQVYLIFTCQITGFYVKAVVDKNHSMVYILNYEKVNNQWKWIETTCYSCIQHVRRALSDGGCTVPFAIDQLDYDANAESEDFDNYYRKDTRKKKLLRRR